MSKQTPNKGEESNSPTSFSEPLKTTEAAIFRTWPALKRYSSVIGPIVVFSVGAWLIKSHLDAGALNAKDATIQNLQTRADNYAKDNERLSKENAEYKTAIAEHAVPLKKQTYILCAQLDDLVQRYTTNRDDSLFWNEYGARFENRIARIVAQLDEAGEHSPTLAKVVNSLLIQIPLNLTALPDITALSKELKKSADNLKQ